MIEIRIARLSLLDTDATFKVIPVVSYLPAYNEADPINQKILKISPAKLQRAESV